MEKPTFIFFAGIAYSGTTSLYYTLVRNNYLNGGFQKEDTYLDNAYGFNMYNPTHKNPYDMNNPNYIKDRFLEIHHRIINQIPDVLIRENQIKSLSKFSVSQIESYFANNTCTIENYIQYKRDLYEYSKDTFDVVGDFENSKIDFSEDVLKNIKENLSQYFNIKVIMILRDPIRRSFSQTSYLCHKTNKSYFFNTSMGITLRMSYYPYYIDKYQKIFGKENFCYLIMEDFFDLENVEERNKLETFIGKKLDIIHPCCFVPDKGINPPKISGLMDQWDCDHDILTEEMYMMYKLDTNHIYKGFKDLHGFLPANWGNPIDYGY